MLSFSFLWEIENLKPLFHEDITGHPFIHSSEFFVNDNDQYAFKLRMYPKSDTETNANHISLFLHLSSKLLTKAVVLYRFSIIDCKSQKFNSLGGRAEVTKETGNGYSKYASRETILNFDNGLLRSGKLSILCEGEVIPDADALSESDLSNRYDKFCNTSYVHSNKGCFSAMRSIQFSAKWEIDDYRNQSKIKDYSYIESSQFSPRNESDYKFKLLLYPKGLSGKNKDFLLPFLSNESIFSKPLLILFKISIIDNNGQRFNTKSSKQCFGVKAEPDAVWGWTDYLKHDDIWDINLMQNDTLTIVCEGEIIQNGDTMTELDLENHLNIFASKQMFKCVPIIKTNNQSKDENIAISKLTSLNLKNDI